MNNFAFAWFFTFLLSHAHSFAFRLRYRQFSHILLKCLHFFMFWCVFRLGRIRGIFFSLFKGMMCIMDTTHIWGTKTQCSHLTDREISNKFSKELWEGIPNKKEKRTEHYILFAFFTLWLWDLCYICKILFVAVLLKLICIMLWHWT